MRRKIASLNGSSCVDGAPLIKSRKWLPWVGRQPRSCPRSAMPGRREARTTRDERPRRCESGELIERVGFGAHYVGAECAQLLLDADVPAVDVPDLGNLRDALGDQP